MLNARTHIGTAHTWPTCPVITLCAQLIQNFIMQTHPLTTTKMSDKMMGERLCFTQGPNTEGTRQYRQYMGARGRDYASPRVQIPKVQGNTDSKWECEGETMLPKGPDTEGTRQYRQYPGVRGRDYASP